MTPVIFVLVYLLPSLIAGFRGHRGSTSIALWNIVAGWTIIGWFICLTWATNSNVKGAV